MFKMYVKLPILLAAVLSITACANTVVNQQASSAAGSAESSAADASSAVASADSNSSNEPMAGKTVTIGYNGGLCTGAPAIALAKGYFKEEGIDVEIVGIQAANEAIGTGKIQLYTDHIATALVPAVNDVDMTFVAGAQTGCKSLYVLKDSEFNSTSDLIGKNISISDAIGGSDHNITLRFLNNDNIKPEEVNFKNIERSAVIQSLQSGEVQAALLPDQFAETFINDGTLRIIRSITYDEDFKNEPCCVHIFNGEFVRQNPEISKKMAKAIVRARNWTEDNKKEATQILFDNGWASGDFDLALKMMESYNFKVSNETSENSLRDVIEDYKKFGIINTDKTTDEIMQKVWTPLTDANEEPNE